MNRRLKTDFPDAPARVFTNTVRRLLEKLNFPKFLCQRHNLSVANSNVFKDIYCYSVATLSGMNQMISCEGLPRWRRIIKMGINKNSFLQAGYAAGVRKYRHSPVSYLSKDINTNRNVSMFKMIAAAGIIALLQSCGPKEHHFNTSAETPAEQPSIEVTAIQRGRLASEIKIPGELRSFQQVDLYAKVNSYVKSLSADIGSEVQAGQVLATMEAPEINSQLAASQSRISSVEATYIASKANYDRLLETSKTPGTISPNDLDMALARQKSDYAQLQAAKSSYNEVGNNRDYLQIRAPFTGVVTARNVSMGAYVGPSGKGSDLPLFTLQTQQKLRLAVSVPEAYTRYLNDNSEVRFTVASRPNEIFKAQVKRLAGALDQRYHSEKIEMDVNNTDKRLLAGMVAEIIIPLPANDSTLLVPVKAVINSTEKTAVIKVVNGKAQWVEVQTGRASDKQIEVFGNLNAGDTIVSTASEEVRDGTAVGKTKMIR